MSSVVDIPVHLALVLLLANGGALPEGIDRHVLAPRTAEAGATRPADLGYSEERWLDAIERHGRTAGLDDLAERVFRTSSGRVYTPVAADRRAIVALLADPAVAARVAAAATRSDAARLARSLGRAATPAELYAAHLLGIEAAETLLHLARTEPVRAAAEAMPQQALAAPQLFFRGTRPRRAGEVVREIEVAFARALPRASRNAGLGETQRPVR